MKNQTAKFTSSTDATLAVSLFQGKTAIKVMVRQKTPDEKTQVGCKDYFDLGQDAEAQRAFDQRVKEAIAAGWSVNERRERAPGFTAVPQAPGGKKADVTGGQVSSAPRAAAGRR